MMIRGLLVRGPLPVLRTMAHMAQFRPGVVLPKLADVPMPGARILQTGKAMFQGALKAAIAQFQGTGEE